jgi:hypothetical protein
MTNTIIDQSLQSQGLPEWTIIVFAVVGVIIVAIAIGLLIGLSVTFLNRSRYVHCILYLMLHAYTCKPVILCSHGRFDVDDVNQDILTSESPSGTLRTARSNSFSYQKVSH